MTKAFVSYKRKDTEFARKLVDALVAREIEVWIDWESIPPTVDWREQIQKGVEEADIFLFLLSPESLKSRECAEELAHAVKNGKRLIPLVVRPVNSEEAPQELRHINWIFFNKKEEFDKSFQKLIEAIQTDYEWVQIHRRLQVKALDWERQHKENSFLLHGKDLEFAEAQLVANASKNPKPTDLQTEYILKSKKARENRRRFTTGLSIGVAVIMLILTLFALRSAQEARVQKAVAEKNEQIAKAEESRAVEAEKLARDNATVAQIGEISALALSKLDQNYNDALLYGVEAYRRAIEMRSNRATALSTLTLLTSLLNRSGLNQILPEHDDWISSLAYSPDGKTLASSSWDNMTYLWEISDLGDPIRIQSLNANGAVFGPNGNLLVTSGYDKDYNDQIILWDVTDRANPSQLGILNSETQAIYALVNIKPDNALLVTLGYEFETGDSLIQLWDISNPSTPALINTINGWYASLSPDGTILAVASYDVDYNYLGLILWDITDPVTPIQLGSLQGDFATFHPKDQTLATLNYDELGTYIQLTDISDPAAPQALGVLRGHADTVSSIVFSPDGTILALGSEEGNIYLWDVQDPAHPPYRPFNTLNAHSTSVWQITFSPDGGQLVTGGADGTIMLWNLANTHNPLRINIEGFGFSIADSSNGKFSATQTYEDSSGRYPISIWDSSDPTSPIELGRFEANEFVDYALLSDGGKRLVYTGYDPESEESHVYWWDLSDLKNPVQTEIPTASTSYPAAISPNGSALVLGDYDEENNLDSLTLWNMSDSMNPVLLQTFESLAGNNITFGPTGKTLVISGYDTTKQSEIMMLWDVSSPDGPTLIDTLEDIFGSYSITSLDGNFVALSYGDAITYRTVVWDASTTGKYTKLGTLEGSNPIFSPDGSGFALETTDMDNNPIVQLWNISNLGKGTPIEEARGYNLGFSPDGNRIILRRDNAQSDVQDEAQQGAYDLLIWNIADPGRPLSEPLVGHTKDITSISFSPDEKTLASASLDKTIILWDVSNPTAPLQLARLSGHSAAVTNATFSPDGLMLASGGDDTNLILWSLSDLKEIVQIGSLKGHSGGIYNIVFSSDGKRLVSYGAETIVWDLDPNSWMKKACNLTGHNFTQDRWRELFGDEPYRETCVNETVASTPTIETESTESEEPAPGASAAELPICSEAEGQSVQSCVENTLEERDLFCVEKTPYTLYALPEGATLESVTEGFSCTDEGVRNGYQLYTCYGTPSQQFTGQMCNSSCAAGQSSQCSEGYGLDASQSCCTPLSVDGCVNVTLAIGACQ